MTIEQLQEIVAEQVEEMGLWFDAKFVTEAHLQAELRRLHLAIEQLSGREPRQ